MPSPSLAIGLGANLGDPLLTLLRLRPLLAGLFAAPLRQRWSPLFRTAPVGGPPGQPDYLNAVLLLEAPGEAWLKPSHRHPSALVPPANPGLPLPEAARFQATPGPASRGGERPQAPHPAGPWGPAGWPQPLELLRQLQALEQRFGRRRRERWGPRLLDLDLLWCVPHRCAGPTLTLPHPLLSQRSFVLAPLLAIDPALELPAAALPRPDEAPQAVQQLLEELLPRLSEPPPERLAAQIGWPE